MWMTDLCSFLDLVIAKQEMAHERYTVFKKLKWGRNDCELKIYLSGTMTTDSESILVETSTELDHNILPRKESTRSWCNANLFFTGNLCPTL